MSESPNLSRRDFLKVFIQLLLGLGGILGLGGLLRFLSYPSEPGPPSEYDLGDASLFPAGSRTVRTDIPAVIYNEAGEIKALSLTCTHLGCTVEVKNDSLVCPCHGSHFTKVGEVVKGPAPKSLHRLHVEVREDQTVRLYTERDGK